MHVIYDTIKYVPVFRNRPMHEMSKVRRHESHEITNRRNKRWPHLNTTLFGMVIINIFINIGNASSCLPLPMPKLLGIMKPFICGVGDWIFEAGEHGKDMYILVHGVVEFCQKGSIDPFAVTEAPNCFGEKMAFGLNKIQSCSARAATMCDLYR